MALVSSAQPITESNVKEIAGRSLWTDARRRFMRNRAAVLSTFVLILIALACFGAPFMGLRTQDEINWDKVNVPPSWWPERSVETPVEAEPSSADISNPETDNTQIAEGAETFDLSQFTDQQEENNEQAAEGDAVDSAEEVETDSHADFPYLFGTDVNGRDLFVRTLYGGQVSLSVALVATLVSLVIGVLWGASAGFLGGWVDSVMMRIVDILYSVPFIFFVIMLTVAFGRNILLIYLAIGAVSWLDMARIVRGQTISLKRKEFIEAAHASGVSAWRIITKHIIPNCLGPVVVYMMLTVPAIMLTESFISYLGMGVQEPQSSWGTLISEGSGSLESSPWQVLFPGLTLAITLLCLNFIGDGLRDALDPKDR